MEPLAVFQRLVRRRPFHQPAAAPWWFPYGGPGGKIYLKRVGLARS